jgi:hypothetical protein
MASLEARLHCDKLSVGIEDQLALGGYSYLLGEGSATLSARASWEMSTEVFRIQQRL